MTSAGTWLGLAAPCSAATLTVKHSGLCLEVPESRRDDAGIVQRPCHGGPSQEWELREAGEGTVSVVSQLSGQCLHVAGGSRGDGIEVTQSRCHGGDNQRFSLDATDGHHHTLVARHSDKCLGIGGASRKKGAPLVQWSCSGADDQKFLISGVRPPAATRATEMPSAPPPTVTPPASPPGGKLERVLCILPSPRSIARPRAQDLLEAFDAVHAAGAGGTYVAATWKELETVAGNETRLDEFKEKLDFLANRFNIYLSLQVINSTVKETPDDLKGVPFDSPQMRKRFRAFLDALLPRLNPRVKTISIGTEVDVYFVRHGEWAAFKTFFENAAGYIHAKAPGLLVGTTFTYVETVGPRNDRLRSLVALSDVAMITYYALGPGFRPRRPEAPLTDIPEMLAFAGEKPLLLEVGYPSSPALASSEEQQVAFFRNAMSVWKRSGDRIPVLNVYALHDENPRTCQEQSKYYGLPGDPRFIAYLCSLGLRRGDGTPKAAWPVVLEGRSR